MVPGSVAKRVVPCGPPHSASSFRLSCSRTWGPTGCQRATTTVVCQVAAAAAVCQAAAAAAAAFSWLIRIRLICRLRRRRRRRRRRHRVAPPRRSRPCGPRCLQAIRPCSPPSAIMNVLLPTMAFAKTVGLVRLSLIATCAPLRLRPNSTPVCADKCADQTRARHNSAYI